MLNARFILTTLLLLALVAPPPSTARAATPEQVDQAIEKAKGWLYSQQANGHWDNEELAQTDQRGGLTAFVVYTLLAMGESPQDERLRQAIDWMLKNDAHGTYAISLRCQVWNLMPRTAEVRAALKKDADKLHFTMGPGRTAGVRGLYSYTFDNQSNADPSCSQYGALGMWAAAQAGVEVPEAYWQQVDKQWRKLQEQGGGWSYQGEPGDDGKIRASMTAAGIATLYIAQDQLNAGKPVQCKGNLSDADIDRAMKWMTDHFDKAIDKGGYVLYTLERMGLASGRKYIGTHDWYQEGADRILKRQHANGSFPNQVPWLAETCFNTLFLVRGRAPMVMSKLEYSVTADKAPKVGNWNQRPRDVANIVHWIGKQTERHLAWQITNLDAPVEDLLDAPILYIAGNQPLKFTDDELAKLKAYVEAGGLILGNADCAAAGFADSFKALGKKLFPAYEFAPLPDAHPIYTNQQFNRAKWKRKPTIVSLHNGARELMILLPTDPAKAWQMQQPGGKEELFQSVADIFLYAVDTQGLRARGASHFVKADPKVKASRPIKVARLGYPGNFDPEPGGWRRLAAVMHNASQGELTVETVTPDSAKLDGFQVAHLTGTGAFTLTPAAREEIKRFTSAGGTLVVDSAGGSSEFAISAEKELDAMFGADAEQLAQPLPSSQPLYSAGGKPLGETGYRKFARVMLGLLDAPQLRGIAKDGRLIVIYSKEDLSVGLVGQQVDGILGYDPLTATALMSKVLVYSTEKQTTSATTQSK